MLVHRLVVTNTNTRHASTQRLKLFHSRSNSPNEERRERRKKIKRRIEDKEKARRVQWNEERREEERKRRIEDKEETRRVKWNEERREGKEEK